MELCELSDLPKDQCAHCRKDKLGDEEESDSFYTGALSKLAYERTKAFTSNRPRK